MSPGPEIDHIRRPQILAAATAVIAERGVAARVHSSIHRVQSDPPAADSSDTELGDARRRLDDRWREEIAGIVRDGQAAGEFGAIDAEEAALTLGALLDGLAVQTALGDPVVSEERMREVSLRAAESLLDCDLRVSAAASARTTPKAAVQ